MRLKEYMSQTFPDLELKKPLFYSWDIGIRFELGVDYDPMKLRPYLDDVHNRAITLFEALHTSQDTIYLVVNVNDFGDGKVIQKRLNILSKYVKKKSNLFQLQQQTIPFVYSEDNVDENYVTHRFYLKCKLADFQYRSMLKAICNQDMGIKPRIFHEVYFINIEKNTIFHVYDDRGCDVVAASPKAIEPIYQTYNQWVLDYDRLEIDQVFKS